LIYRAYDLVGEQYNQIKTEILFTVASARSMGVELLRLDLSRSEKNGLQSRRYRFVTMALQQMKKTGKIQFFATKANFDNSTVEAEYLKNKYGSMVELEAVADIDGFVFVKL
jgi:hypothetical protein